MRITHKINRKTRVCNRHSFHFVEPFTFIRLKSIFFKRGKSATVWSADGRTELQRWIFPQKFDRFEHLPV